MPNPASNPGLVADCATLLAAKDTLGDDDGNLDWAANVPINRWIDVTVRNNRVTSLELIGLGLTGSIPSQLGNLAKLEHLHLYLNELTGEIPAQLGNLSNLETLDLRWNWLRSEIPEELGDIPNLRYLALMGSAPELGRPHNSIHGCIPTSLRAALGSGEIRLLVLPICAAPTATPTSAATATPTATATPIPTATPTPTPTATPASVIETSPTPTETPTSAIDATPTPTETPASVIETSPTPTGTPASAIDATPTPTETPASVIETSPTPAPTSAPGATATPTPTPASTSSGSGDVMDRLDALGRQVAGNPGLSSQVAEIANLVAAMADLITTMAARIAELEAGSAPGAATATPTHTATSVPGETPVATPTPTHTATPIAASPTPTATSAPTATPTATATPAPTATPSPTPTSVAVATDYACIERLASGGSAYGSWAAGCVTANPPPGADNDYYARFYIFTLSATARVTITLSSADAAPYLYLLNGAGTGGSINQETGSGASSAAITTTLQPGSYTIEATTWDDEDTGAFTLTLNIAQP